MLYIQQSLNPNEEIIRVGHFHWWYTMNAALWVVMALIAMIGIFYAGFYFYTAGTVGQYVPGSNIINAKSSGYWEAAIEYNGGVMKTIQSMHFGFKIAGVFVLMMGILAFASRMITKATTEICLTTDRLAMKQGWISRHTAEISIDRIEGVDVFQGVLGRMMDFGYVSVRGMGVGEIALPQIEEPVDFRRAIERSRSMKKGEI